MKNKNIGIDDKCVPCEDASKSDIQNVQHAKHLRAIVIRAWLRLIFSLVGQQCFSSW